MHCSWQRSVTYPACHLVVYKLIGVPSQYNTQCVHNAPVINMSRRSQELTLDAALPRFLCKTPTKCEVDRMNVKRQTETPFILTMLAVHQTTFRVISLLQTFNVITKIMRVLPQLVPTAVILIVWCEVVIKVNPSYLKSVFSSSWRSKKIKPV